MEPPFGFAYLSAQPKLPMVRYHPLKYISVIRHNINFLLSLIKNLYLGSLYYNGLSSTMSMQPSYWSVCSVQVYELLAPFRGVFLPPVCPITQTCSS